MKPYYQDAAVTLYHASCIDVMAELDHVDHTISDPPYARDVYVRASSSKTKLGSGTPGRLYRGAGLAQLAAGDIGDINELLEPVAAAVARLTRRWALVFSDAETTHRWRAALEDGGLRYIRTGAWVKPDPMPQITGDRPGVGFEPCTIAHSIFATSRTPMRWNGGGTAAVWTHFTAKGSGRPEGHPCPKPLPLMVEIVKLFTDEGDLILDPFGGTATTARAAKLNGRRCIVSEVREEYCEISARELEQTRVGELFGKLQKAKPQSLIDTEVA